MSIHEISIKASLPKAGRFKPGDFVDHRRGNMFSQIIRHDVSACGDEFCTLFDFAQEKVRIFVPAVLVEVLVDADHYIRLDE